MKVLTASLLAVLYLFATNLYADWDHTKVLGYKKCTKCHEEEQEIWEQSKHSTNAEDFHKSPEAIKIAEAMGMSKKQIKKPDSMCVTCHYTLGHKKEKPKVLKKGIACESCHGPGKDWFKAHRPKGKGVTRDNETDEARIARHKEIQAMGMVIPSDAYGLASNCLSCHLAPNQKLIDKGNHPAGSAFELYERIDKIKHGPELTTERKNLIKVLGYAVELEHSLVALSEAQGQGTYLNKMYERAHIALANLNAISKATGVNAVKSIVAMAPNPINPTDKSGLKSAAAAIGKAAKALSDSQNGAQFSALSNYQHIKTTNIPAMGDGQAARIKEQKRIEAEKQAAAEAKRIAEAKKAAAERQAAEAKRLADAKKSAAQREAAEAQRLAEAKKAAAERQAAEAKRLADAKKAASASGAAASSVASTVTSAAANLATTAVTTTAAVGSAVGVGSAPEAEAVEPVSADNRLIEYFNIYTPPSKSLCKSDQQWLLGKVQVDSFTKLPSQSCFAMEIKVQQGAQVFLISQSSGSAPFVLLPDGCNAFDRAVNDEVYHVPGANSALRFDEGAATESFYLVVSNDQASADAFKKIAGGYDNACGQRPTQVNRGSLQSLIDKFIAAHPGAQFVKKSFEHE